MSEDDRMTWSLENAADKVNDLLDLSKDTYPPEEERFFSREQALAIINAALLGYSVRADSTAGAYAAMNLYGALGLKGWTFDDTEAAALQAFRNKKTP
jgi:hypothetical protein